MRTRARDRALGVRLVVGVALTALGWWTVAGAEVGIEDVELAVATADGTLPVTVLVPAGATRAPGIVIAHGFAGSRMLMRAWSLAYARAGYVVAAPDLTGHGANVTALPGEPDPDRLAADVLATLDVLAARPEVDAERLVLLGHSMGSRAVLAAGVAAPERVRAVVAVSPTGDAPGDATRPPDLLLLAGRFEGRFVANAEGLLARAGGPRGRAGDGDARALGIVPGVEHVTILFAPAAHDASIAWTDAALGRTSGPREPVRTMLGWLAALVGTVLLWQALAAALVTPVDVLRERRSPLPGMAVATVGATALLVVLGRAADLSALGGMLVGPALALWLLVLGVGWWWSGARPSGGDGRDVGWALIALGAFVLAFGLLADRTWLAWWLARPRAVLAVPLALTVLPFTLAWAAALHPRRGLRAIGWWALGSAVLVAGAGVAALTVPGLGVLVLFVPLLPGVLGLITAVVRPLERPWAAGVASAAFLGWTIAAIFPLA